MEKIYFISDVHLGAHCENDENEKIGNLLAFFKEIEKKTDYLYIVGDLYNFWFEYKHVIPKINLRVLAKLIELIEAGVEVRYFLGNHDQWHETYFADETGIQIYPAPAEVVHNDLRLYIAHGDGLAANDSRNQVLHKIFHSKLNRKLFRLLHPDWGMPLAQAIARKSAKRGLGGHEDDYRNFAVQKINQGYDAVIFGHTHLPLFEKIGLGYFVNLGDWFSNFTYLVLDGTEFSFISWNEKS